MSATDYPWDNRPCEWVPLRNSSALKNPARDFASERGPSICLPRERPFLHQPIVERHWDYFPQVEHAGFHAFLYWPVFEDHNFGAKFPDKQYFSTNPWCTVNGLGCLDLVQSFFGNLTDCCTRGLRTSIAMSVLVYRETIFHNCREALILCELPLLWPIQDCRDVL